MRDMTRVLAGTSLVVLAVITVTKAFVPQSTFRAATDLVQVEVSVLDHDRHPVAGLTASDFSILEDGKPRSVAAFTAVDLPARNAGRKTAWASSTSIADSTNVLPEEGRLLVILMDYSIPVGFPSKIAKDTARAAIQELGDNDLAAIAYTLYGEPQDFTNNRATLLSVLDRTYPGLESSPEIEARMQALKADLAAGLQRPINTAETTGECYCGICTHRAIQRVAEAMRRVSRRRKLLLFLGTDLRTDTTDQLCGPIIQKALANMFQAVDIANVTIHAVDVRGLETTGATASYGPGGDVVFAARARTLLMSQGNLAVLPDRTGGRTIKNTNDPVTHLPDLFRESESYYVLGFVPATPPDGTRHKIQVKVNHRSVVIRGPKEYVADKRTPLDWTAARRASAATDGVLPIRDGLTLHATPAVVVRPPQGDAVVVMTLAAAHDAAGSGAGPDAVDAVTRVLTMTGEQVTMFNQTIDLSRAQGEAPLNYEFTQQFPLRPGRYEVRTGVQDSSVRQQVGSVYTYVDVPDFSKLPLFMSAVVFHRRGDVVFPGANLQDVFPFLPTARRQFSRTEQAEAIVRVFRRLVGGGPVTVVVRLVDEQGKSRLEDQAQLLSQAFSPDGSADCSIGVPLTELASGKYLLSFEAQRGSQFVRRQTAFEVIPTTTAVRLPRPSSVSEPDGRH